MERIIQTCQTPGAAAMSSRPCADSMSIFAAIPTASKHINAFEQFDEAFDRVSKQHGFYTRYAAPDLLQKASTNRLLPQ